MEAFASQFEKMLMKEREAADLVKKILAHGVGRTELIFFLQWATDPNVDRTAGKSYEKIKRWLPSRKKTSALAARMERLAHEMEVVFSHPFYAVLSKSQKLIEIARLLRTEAVTVKSFPRPRTAKLLSNKSLWKHVRLALLCRLLDVPKAFSYSETQKLLWYAFHARGIEPKAVDRGLEKEVRLFERSLAGKLFYVVLRTERPRGSPTSALPYLLFRRIVGQKGDKYLLMARMMD